MSRVVHMAKAMVASDICTLFLHDAEKRQLWSRWGTNLPTDVITGRAKPIRVRDGIALVTEALQGLAAATSYGAAATLLTGFIVLIGAAAAGERAHVFESLLLDILV